jgi:AraC-like DNA-binding protein
MHFRMIAPPPDLADAVAALWSLEGAAPGLGPPILPDGCAELILHLGAPLQRLGSDDARQPEAFVFGQLRQAIRLADPGGSAVLAVRFTPAGLALWGGWNASALEAREHALGALLPAAAQPPLEALRTASSFARRIDLLCTWLRRRRHTPRRDAGARLAAEAARRLAVTPQAISTLAHDLCIGRRRLERQFAEAVGLAPAEYARLLRIQHAADALLAGPASLAELAIDHGFSDQAHFTRRFTEVAGISPGRFRALHGGH